MGSISQIELRRLHQAAVQTAGARYTSDAHVGLPIMDAFDALMRTSRFYARIDRMAHEVDRRGTALLREHGWESAMDGGAPRLRRLGRRAERLAQVLRDVPRDPAVEISARAISRSASRIEAEAEALRDDLYEKRRQEPTGDEGAEPGARIIEDIANGLNALRSIAGEVATYGASPEAQATNRRALLLTGEAGQGKTHLLCDVVGRSLDEGRPAILLMGQHFRGGMDLWRQISQLVGIRGLGGQGALSALERIGGRKRCRVLLAIDALNEGGGLDLWPDALLEIIEEARRHPHLVIAVSCRSSYLSAIVPRRVLPMLSRFEHQGFSGVEAEATTRFFSHYGLRHPTIPLLSPEFSRPLFLKLFCEGLRGRRTAPSGHQGMTDVLENFARAVGRQIARDMNRREQVKLPWNCLKQLASEMAQRGVDTLGRSEAEAIAVAYVKGRLDGREMFQRMIDGGLLAEDVWPEGGQARATVRFPYQQFSDHLIARYLLRHHLDRAKPRRCFGKGGALRWIVSDRNAIWRHSGLLEALAIQIPEWTTSEFLDLVPDRAHVELHRAHIQSLIWRRPDRFPNLPKAVRYLNEAAQSGDSLMAQAWSALLTVAVLVDHPLNAGRLHASLRSRSMPVRDATWSRFLHENWGADGVVDRYVNWSDSVDARALPDDVLLLAGTTMTWFFTSSNRFVRDRATKALVRILRGRFAVVSTLLEVFRGVNDPYVEERLLCSAYGVVLLSADVPAIENLARQVNRDYLSGQSRHRHVLVRDYAEGICARAKALSSRLRLRTVRTRWSKVAFRPPTRQHLSDRYRGDDAFSSIWFSVMAQGDFDRYVIEPAVRQFTRYRLDQKVPPRTMPPLSAPAQVSVLPLDVPSWVELIASEPHGAASQAQRVLKERFDLDLARRWIFARVMSLGWTPERFGEFDQVVNYRNMREAKKPERIGKKYQWIALHELLGLLVDNFRWRPGFGSESARQCPGGWALAIRDIDPSHLALSRPAAGGRVWWRPLPGALKPLADDDMARWVENRYWPDATRLILLTDEAGDEWLVTEGQFDWTDDKVDRLGDQRYPYRRIWYQLRCYLVRDVDADRMRSWLAEQDFMGRWMPESISHHGDFVAEYPWHPSAATARQGWVRGRHGDPSLPAPVLNPAASLAWDDSFDASTGESYEGIVPAALLVSELHASWRPPFDYVLPSGRVVGMDPSWHSAGPSVGLIRRRDFDQLCRRLGVVPFWTLLGEKHVIEAFLPDPTLPWREISGSYEVEADRVVGSSRQRIRRSAR